MVSDDIAYDQDTGSGSRVKTAMPKTTALRAGEQRHVSTCRVIDRGMSGTNGVVVARCRRLSASPPCLK